MGQPQLLSAACARPDPHLSNLQIKLSLDGLVPWISPILKMNLWQNGPTLLRMNWKVLVGDGGEVSGAGAVSRLLMLLFWQHTFGFSRENPSMCPLEDGRDLDCAT